MKWKFKVMKAFNELGTLRKKKILTKLTKPRQQPSLTSVPGLKYGGKWFWLLQNDRKVFIKSSSIIHSYLHRKVAIYISK